MTDKMAIGKKKMTIGQLLLPDHWSVPFLHTLILSVSPMITLSSSLYEGGADLTNARLTEHNLSQRVTGENTDLYDASIHFLCVSCIL